MGRIRAQNESIILDAAEREFAEYGFKGASMMNIAKRAQLPRPNVHYYFKNKLELYNSILMDILELWNDAFNNISPEDDPAEALEGYIRAKVNYSMTHPIASRIFANEILHGAPHLQAYLNKEFRVWLMEKAKVIESWIKQGKMQPVDPLHLIFLIWSATQFYADCAIQVKKALETDVVSKGYYKKVADSLCQIVITGCGLKSSV